VKPADAAGAQTQIGTKFHLGTENGKEIGISLSWMQHASMVAIQSKHFLSLSIWEGAQSRFRLQLRKQIPWVTHLFAEKTVLS